MTQKNGEHRRALNEMEVNDVEQLNLNNLSTEHKQRKGRKKKKK